MNLHYASDKGVSKYRSNFRLVRGATGVLRVDVEKANAAMKYAMQARKERHDLEGVTSSRSPLAPDHLPTRSQTPERRNTSPHPELA